MQQCFAEILPGGWGPSRFGLSGANHFERLSGVVFALHRLSAPSGVAKSDFNLYGQLCPSGSCTPLRQVPGGPQILSGCRELRETVGRAEVPRTSAGFRNHIRGKTGSAELGSPVMAAHFSVSPRLSGPGDDLFVSINRGEFGS